VRAEDIRRVGVVGVGVMGAGIVQVAAQAGLEVVYVEPTAERLEHGRQRLERELVRAVDAGRLDPDERDAALARTRGATELGALAEVDLVIEAATEDRSIKADILRALDGIVADEVVLASNTSSIPIASLAAATTRPDRVVGLHFFNPVPRMELVEVTPSLATSAATVELVEGFARRLGKRTVRSADRAGFIVNRLLIPYLCGAIRLLDEGVASAEDLDLAITAGLRHPMGPLALADLVGLDVVLQTAEVLHAEFGDPAYAPPPLLRRMVELGRLGRKSGRGFFAY
jgi:3-hydroxybutyryl-CoA dehydrogenase